MEKSCDSECVDDLDFEYTCNFFDSLDRTASVGGCIPPAGNKTALFGNSRVYLGSPFCDFARVLAYVVAMK